MRALLVEDDVLTAKKISTALRGAGMVVDETDLAEDALEMVRTYDYDVVVLDSHLSDLDGLTLLRRIRKAGYGMPVLMLSGDPSPQVRVKALNAGGDDFMLKPVDHDELVARLQAIVRRSRGFSAATIQVGRLQINLDTREVSVEGQPVPLTGKEYAILELLVMRKGTVLTKDAFLNHLYGGLDEPEMKIIDVFICKLRKKLQAAGVSDMIGTVWGRGYMLREPGSVTAFAGASDEPELVSKPVLVM